MVAIKDFGMPSCCVNCDMCTCDNPTPKGENTGYCDITQNSIIDIYNERPSDCPLVEIEERKGKWIKSNIGGAKVCSSCQAHMGLSNFKYCPNCGAKMRGDEE